MSVTRLTARPPLWLTLSIAILWLAFCVAVSAKPVSQSITQPVYFEQNLGQADAAIRFVTHEHGQQVGLLKDGFRFQSRQRGQASGVTFKWVDASSESWFSAEQPSIAKLNYYIGSSFKLEQIPSFSRLRQHQLYPGIDVLYRFDQQQRLEYDLIVAANVDPAPLRLHIEGARNIQLDEAGHLRILTEDGVISQKPPVVFQQGEAERLPVEAAYVLLSDHEVGFRLGEYDRQRELVIDPVVTFSSYLGGASSDNIHAVAWADDGSLLVAGTTATRVTITPANDVTVEDSQFPLAGFTPAPSHGAAASACVYDYDESQRGADQVLTRYDGFLSKIDPDSGQLLFSTYFGGCENDTVRDIALDASGNIYLTGMTLSANFPVTTPPLQISSEKADAFVAKFAADGSLIYSRYLGGRESDFGRGIAVDQNGYAYVTGSTQSDDFEGNRCNQGAGWRCLSGKSDAFIARISTTGETVGYMNYLGGLEDDFGAAITLKDHADPAQVVIYLAGTTASSDFPVPAASSPYSRYQANEVLCGRSDSTAVTDKHVCTDAFVARLTERGKTLELAVVFGGAEDESAVDLALDSADNIIAIGTSRSAGVVLNENTAIDPALPENRSLLQRFPLYNPIRDDKGNSDRLGDTGSVEAFVTGLAADGESLAFSSFLRGGDVDIATGLAVSQDDEIYVTGRTRSSNFFPIKNAFQKMAASEDVFITKLDNQSQLVYSTLLGAEHLDGANAMALKQETVNSALVNTLALGGSSFSLDFPAINAIQATAAGGDSDGFVITVQEPVNDVQTDLQVTMSLSQTTATEGDSIDLAATITNLGAESAENVRLVIKFPTGVNLTSSSSSCLKEDLMLFCDAGDLSAAGGGSDTVQLRMEAVTRFAGEVMLTVSTQSLTTDIDMSNNTLSQVITVKGKPRVGSLDSFSLWGLLIFLGWQLSHRRLNSAKQPLYR